jgi:hypothetical protein
MGEDIGAACLRAASNKINVTIDFENACQAGQASPSWDPLDWWKSPAWKAWQEYKAARLVGGEGFEPPTARM